MLRGAMSVTAALPVVPRAVARRVGSSSAKWGGGQNRRRSCLPTRAVARTSYPRAFQQRYRASSKARVVFPGPRFAGSSGSSARFAASRGDAAGADGCASTDPGSKKPIEETVDDDAERPRGVVNGVVWASSRILQLDENVPGWWSFPHADGTPALEPVVGQTREVDDGNEARTTLTLFDRNFRDSSWRRFVDRSVRPPSQTHPVPLQKVSIAPMMEYTTPHFRHLVRLMTKNTWLYTEMEVDQTLRHSDFPRLDRFLDFPILGADSTSGHPTSLQLGGSDPELLALASKVAAPYGYDELNLNCGCPSPKVAGKGSFGASLMLDPVRVGECVAAMREFSGGAPVTVKCRIGVDACDSYDALCRFVEIVSKEMPGCPSANGKPLFAIHARKAFLDGLSPAENRAVPPLRYEWVYALARDFPDVAFALNGGIVDLETAVAIARGDGTPRGVRTESGTGDLLGVMIGRQSHADPWGLLPTVDRDVYGEMENPPAASSRRELLRAYGEYCDATRGRYGVTRDGYAVPSARHLMHPVQNLFRGEPNAKRWRRAVDDALKRQNPRETVSELIDRTLKESAMSDETLDAPPEARWARKGGSELTREEASFEKKQRYARAVERLASVPPAPPRIEASDA